jgi:hypothetical protein
MGMIYNPTIKNNETWTLLITISQPSGDPFDLTTYTGKSQIRSHDGLTVLGTPVVTVVAPTLGQLKVFLSLAQAAILKPTSTTCLAKNPLPIWDVIIGNADASNVFEVVSGDVSIKAGVTTWP